MKRICIVVSGLLMAVSVRAVTLEECYRFSRENYPLIRQYGLVEKLSQFSFSNAAKAYLPQFAFFGQATYQNAVTEFPAQMNQLYQQMGIDFKGLSNDQYKWMLQLNQTLWDGGITKAQQESIEAETKVSQLTLDKELDALQNRINQIYFGILIMEANLKVNYYVDTLLSNNLKVVQSGVKNGMVLQSDLDNIQVELLSLRQQRTQIEVSIKAYRQVLSLMIGRELPLSEPIERPQMIKITNDNNRTELKLFDAQIEQSEAQRRMVNAAVMPRFDLYAQGWYGRPGLNLFNDMLNNQFSWNYIAGIRFQWNISSFYTHKKDVHKIALSKQSIEVQKKTFLWNLNIQQTQLENEVIKMHDLQQSDNEIVILRQAIRKASESKYQNGIITVSDLLRDITNENNAIQTRSLHELELLKSIYDLKVTLNQ